MCLRFFAVFFSCIMLAVQAYALRLDISADTELKGLSYSKIPFSGKTHNAAFLSENTRLGIAVSGLELEKTKSATADISVSFQSLAGLTADKLLENPYLAQPQESFPSADGTPYLREAYVRVNSLLLPNISAVLGRQDYVLGQGISFASDNIGHTGLLLKADDVFWGYGLELFYFNPSRYSVAISTSGSVAGKPELRKADDKYHVYGAAINNRAPDGCWQIYHFWQHYGGAFDGSFAGIADSETRTFTGLRYAMKKKHISFDGEAVAQGGSADLKAGGTGKYSGYAFIMKGSWEQGIYIFDNVKLRLAYGRSSASSADADENSDFYPAFGSRYSGISRSGYGIVAGASLYDIQKSSATANGLPDGYSGLMMANAGIDIPYKGLIFSADYYKFKASGGAVSRKTIGDEVDVMLSFPLGKAFNFDILYGYFSPGAIFGEDAESYSLASFAFKARF